MKGKLMKLTVITAVLLLVGIGLWLSSHKESSPEQVVGIYCALSADGDVEKTKVYITHVPEKYWDEKMKQVREQQAKVGTTSSTPEAGLVNHSPTLIPNSASNDPWLLMVGETFPKLLHERKQVLKKVSQVWIKGEEARVRAVIGFKDIESDGIEWDFLLYRTDRKWMIFMVQLPTPTETYGLPE